MEKPAFTRELEQPKAVDLGPLFGHVNLARGFLRRVARGEDVSQDLAGSLADLLDDASQALALARKGGGS